MAVGDRCRGFARLFGGRLRNALPTIAFYVAQFLLVYRLFGSQYAMVVSCSTTLFQLRRRQANGPVDYLRFFLVPLVLCLLAFAAGQALWLCVVLNFTVPFFLTLFRSSQFAPKGYLGFAMTFVFLELRPPTPAQLPTQLGAVAFCCALLLAALYLCARLTPRDSALGLQASLERLARLLDLLGDGQGDEAAIRQELYDTAHRFHRMGYDRRLTLGSVARQRQFCHLFAVLFQRAAYLMADDSWQENRALPQFPRAMHTLADLVRRLSCAVWEGDRAALAREIQIRLEEPELPQSRLRIFYRSVLHMLLLLCRGDQIPPRRPLWRRDPREGLRLLAERLSPRRFEFRFALRLAVVMTISCTVSYLWEFEHTYWFPLHAFLLLQPSYEESAHRMVTRPVGTAIGCVVVHLVYPYLPGLPGIFLFSLVMISLMYCCTPGTWVHPIFSTSFALTMATLTVEETEAIGLRLLYLAMAVALVLVVNRFLLPNRRDRQFRQNMEELCRLQAYYWEVVRRSLRQPADPALFSEMLSQFHMVYHEAAQYLRQLPEAEAARHRARLVVLWNMFAELEQVEGLIQSGAVEPEEGPELDTLAAALARRLRSLEDLDGLSPAGLPRDELYYVLDRYLTNARVLCAQGAAA